MSTPTPADPQPDAETEISPDEKRSSDDPSLTELDKTLADSFPSSDPPAQP